jgi:hypothetical protein
MTMPPNKLQCRAIRSREFENIIVVQADGEKINAPCLRHRAGA